MEKIESGSVREIYDVGDGTLVVVTTDRVSVYGVPSSEIMPSKGCLVNQMTNFWYSLTKGKVPNSIIETEKLPMEFKQPKYQGKCTLVKKTEVLPIKVFLYNNLVGTLWKMYHEQMVSKKGYINIGGKVFFRGLEEGCDFNSPVMIFKEKLPNGYKIVSETEACNILGSSTLEMCKNYALSAFKICTDFSKKKGIALVDTQIGFGRASGKVYAIGDFFSPDSTRYWIADRGESYLNYDKQIIIEYLLSNGWERGKELPPIPKSIVYKTATRYIELYELLTGEKFF